MRAKLPLAVARVRRSGRVSVRRHQPVLPAPRRRDRDLFASSRSGSTSCSATPAKSRSAMPRCSASAPTPPACSPFKLGIGFLPALPLAALIAAAFGAILALPALQVTGPYLAMVTLAFGTIVEILINEMTFLTNGPLGISLRQPLFSTGATAATRCRSSTCRSRACRNSNSSMSTRRAAAHDRRDQPAARVALGPRVRGAARQPDRVGLHGRLVYKHKVLAFVSQRRRRRPRRIAVRLFRTIHRPE